MKRAQETIKMSWGKKSLKSNIIYKISMALPHHKIPKHVIAIGLTLMTPHFFQHALINTNHQNKV